MLGWIGQVRATSARVLSSLRTAAASTWAIALGYCLFLPAIVFASVPLAESSLVTCPYRQGRSTQSASQLSYLAE